MKKILLLFIITNFVYSQERVNEERPLLSNKLGSFSEIVGWNFNKYSGKWISEKNNNIYFDCAEISLRKIIIDSIEYKILTIKEKEGAYTYPTIKKEWKEWISYRSYIFKFDEFEKIKKYENIVSKYYEVNTLNDFYDKFDYKELNESVYNSISFGEQKDLNFIFQIKLINNTVKFILPFSRGNEFLEDNFSFEKSYFETSLINFNKIIK